MNEDLMGRLYNWKFESALRYLDGEPQRVRDVVEALARMFGNSGWFSGDVALLVGATLECIGVVDKDDEED